MPKSEGDNSSEQPYEAFNEVDKGILRNWNESIADARFFMSLSSGALLLVAAFLRDDPGVEYARPLVGFALSAFVVSLFANFLDLWWSRDAKIRYFRKVMADHILDRAGRTMKPDEVAAAYDKYKRSGDRADKVGRVGIVSFFVGVLSMAVLGFLIMLSWSSGGAPVPSSMPH